MNNPMYPEVHARAHEVAGEILARHARPREWVADCGAGNLELASALEERGLRVCALDPIRAPGIVQGVWEALPLREGSLAAVTACASLQYAKDPGAAVQAAAKALRPGGVFLALLSPVHKTPAGARKGEATARERTGIAHYRHFDQAEAERLFRGAGLSFELQAFEIPGGTGLKRRLKSAAGIEQAKFPTLLGLKGG